MSSLEKEMGECGMERRKWKVGGWLVIACTLAMFLISAAAQEAPKPAPPATETDPVSKPTQPTTAPDRSKVDSKTYVIGENDVLEVDVWKDKEISRTVPVRPDGKISLPLIGEIQASGMTPLQLQDDIARRLKNFLANPEVTVIVTDPRSHHFNIVGQIAKRESIP